MNRTRFVPQGLDGVGHPVILRVRRGLTGVVWLCGTGLILLSSMPALGAPSLRIAVAPFGGESSAVAVSQALTGRLALRGVERLIAPGEFVATRAFDPSAAEVRRWAHNSAVDTIVVGRVVALAEGDEKDSARRVETILRSGHSGAELSRYDVVVANPGDLDRSLETLAAEILGGLGYVEAPAAESAATADSADAPPEGNAPAAGDRSGLRGLEAELSRTGFRSDAPIEIKADEAEIINREQGRKLIFQRNVRVRQANVTLRSQRLEASYRKGESEPRELIAEGSVEIIQDDRRAHCDRAVYLREAKRLTCEGRAELIQGCDVVRGESIEFDLGSDQARVEGAASIVIQPEEGVVSNCAIGRGES